MMWIPAWKKLWRYQHPSPCGLSFAVRDRSEESVLWSLYISETIKYVVRAFRFQQCCSLHGPCQQGVIETQCQWHLVGVFFSIRLEIFVLPRRVIESLTSQQFLCFSFLVVRGCVFFSFFPPENKWAGGHSAYVHKGTCCFSQHCC